ncbi:MAG: hypothetical protein ACREXY_23590 [Gammaproteobacteria bacterium]
MSFHPPRPVGDPKTPRRLAPGLFVFYCSVHVASVYGAEVLMPAPIRWDLALINGLQVTSESMGIRDRIRVITLGTSGCTPRSARLLTLNPESGAAAEVDIPVQGHSIEFEMEDVARAGALLKIECLESGAKGGPSKTFRLALDPRKAR